MSVAFILKTGTALPVLSAFDSAPLRPLEGLSGRRFVAAVAVEEAQHVIERTVL